MNMSIHWALQPRSRPTVGMDGRSHPAMTAADASNRRMLWAFASGRDMTGTGGECESGQDFVTGGDT